MSDSEETRSRRVGAGDGRSVALVIPAHNASTTLEQCLHSVVQLLERQELLEIVLVDDHSTDGTAEIAAEFPVRITSGRGMGAAAARNDGIAQTASEFIWCLDADCIAHADTLTRLLNGFESDAVAAVGGSLGNACSDSLLANLIQDEITWRHARMPTAVNFLASGNVVYCRSAFETVGGFDEGFRWAHDAELAYRFRSTGHELRFVKDAVVLHHHFTSWVKYLLKQSAYAKNRILLYARYPQNVRGDDYSSWVDHLQPPLALGLLFTLPLVMFPMIAAIPFTLLLTLLACAMFTTASVYLRRDKLRTIPFLCFSVVRSMARALGACHGIATILALNVGRTRTTPTQQDLLQ